MSQKYAISLLILITNFVPLTLDSNIFAERMVPSWSCACLAVAGLAQAVVGEYICIFL